LNNKKTGKIFMQNWESRLHNLGLNLVLLENAPLGQESFCEKGVIERVEGDKDDEHPFSSSAKKKKRQVTGQNQWGERGVIGEEKEKETQCRGQTVRLNTKLFVLHKHDNEALTLGMGGVTASRTMRACLVEDLSPRKRHGATRG